MMWVDYTIDQAGDRAFTIKGDWPMECFGKGRDGSDKEHALARPGDVFRLDENGWFIKIATAEGAVTER